MGECYAAATPEKRATFLAALSDCGNVTKAAKAADLNRVCLYRLARNDPDFKTEWEEAERVGALRLEDEARRRAVEGWAEPVWHRGEMCGTVQKYSDTLLIVLLKAHHPEKYADRQKVDQNVSHSLPDLVAQVDAVSKEHTDDNG